MIIKYQEIKNCKFINFQRIEMKKKKAKKIFDARNIYSKINKLIKITNRIKSDINRYIKIIHIMVKKKMNRIE